MQIKTTVKYHLTLVSMVITKKPQKITTVCKDVEKREPLCTAGGNINS